MRQILLTATMMVAASGLALSQTPAPRTSGEGNKQDEEAIRKVMTDIAEAWNKHDVVAYSMLFANDADFTNWRGTIRAHGREEIKNTHAPLFAGMFRRSNLKVTDTSIRFYTPDVAAVHCDWEMAGIIDYDGKGTIPPRKYLPLFIVTKADGRWWIAVMHNVLIQPLPPGAEEKIKGPVKQ